uniref:Ionotropic receptor 41a.5 n=1 Tax=Adelphocoris lineolatus TaxID=236346 RepID=A0A2I4PH05_ADELI|nr:ionotropic receptor 41a.5 [Adelphocoris lineolatus]
MDLHSDWCNLMCFLIITQHIGSNWCVDHDEMTTGLAHEIAEHYFSEYNECITVVADLGALQKFSPPNNSFIRVSFDHTNDSCDPSVKESLRNSFREKCVRYVVQIAKPNCFFPSWFESMNLGYERHNPTVVFLPSINADDQNYGDDLLSKNETNISADILVAEISDAEEWAVKIYTNNFYQLTHEPERISKIFLDEWHPSKGFRFKADLLPNKLKDLKLKTLRVFTVQYLPYSSYDPFDGSEVRMVKEFCNVVNCTAVGLTNDGNWGTFDEETNTGTGQMGAIHSGEADIGVGGNVVWLEFFPHLDFSDAILGGASAIIAPRPKVLGGWFTPFLPFPLDLWVVVWAVVIASAILLYLFTTLTIRTIPHLAEKHRRNEKFVTFTDSLLRAIGMLISQQPSNLVTGSPVRHLFTSMEVIFLVITTCYCAQLYDFLTVPRTTKPIDTVKDVVENNLTWLAPSDLWIYALKHSDDPVVAKFVQLFQAYPPEEIIELSEKGEVGVTVEKLAGGHYVEDSYISYKFISQSRVSTGPDIYGMTPITLFMQKGSPYTEALNRFHGHMQNGGLHFAWEAGTARDHLNYTIQEGIAQSSRKQVYPPKVLRLADLEGAFLIHFIGVAVSIIVFFIESRVGKKKKSL